jgi:two-component system CheB/CheR fusion protein
MPVRASHLAAPATPRKPRRQQAASASPTVSADTVIVAVGASAGGLNACRKLLNALPADSGMAFIIVQHLDPTHDSMLVELLGSYTAMTVRQAEDGMSVAPDHVYVIPPGTYLSVALGTLHVSAPGARHGARLPFDFLLQSLARAQGARSVSVVLSGTGSDGSLGLRALKAQGGLVLAEAPEEAEYDGMPRSAILTGDVDFVLSIEKMPQAIAAAAAARPPEGAATPDNTGFAAIIDLLRATTSHDFTLYKPGTLKRRIARRMGLAGIAETDFAK